MVDKILLAGIMAGKVDIKSTFPSPSLCEINTIHFPGVLVQPSFLTRAFFTINTHIGQKLCGFAAESLRIETSSRETLGREFAPPASVSMRIFFSLKSY